MTINATIYATIRAALDQICYFCKRAPAESQCPTCKRAVCMECSGSENHNCYPRER